MKRHLTLILMGVLFLACQATVLSSPRIWIIRPDILLGLVLFWGFYLPPTLGGLHAFFLGYLLDLFSGNSFGLYAFSRPLLFYLAYLLRERLYVESFLSQALFGFLFAWLEGLLILLLLVAFTPNSAGNIGPMFFSTYLPQSALTGLVTPFLFLLLGKIHNIFSISGEWAERKRIKP